MSAVSRLLAAACVAASACLAGAPFCVAPDYAAPVKPMTRPEVRNRTVVILGSSTAEGVGASSIATSWAGRLSQQLAKSGIRVENRSRAGTTTGDSLERFDRDVTPLQPGIVILATSIVNEGFAAEPAAAFERYAANSKALVDRVSGIGAIPINITMYPYTKYGPEHMALLEKLTRTLEEWGWPLFNFWSPVAVEGGNWIPSLSADGLHPLDAGHKAFFDAIPDSVFGRLLEQEAGPAQPEAPASIRASETAGEESALRVTPSRALSSWTVAAHLRDPGAGEETRIFSLAGDIPVRLWRRFNWLELWAGEDLVLRRTAPAAGWRHVALSYQHLTGRLILAIDGEVWGEAAIARRTITDSLEIAGNCPSCRIAHLALYRTNLLSGELRWLAGVSVLRRSLDAWAPMSAEPASGANLNALETAARVEIRGDWSLDREYLPPLCAATPPEKQIDGGEPE